MTEGKIDIFSRFQKVFWVVLSFELMERAAYYTMLPVLVLHAYYNVGIPYSWALVLAIFMYPFQYGLPILSGAYAEKAGYRRQMIFAFSFLVMAYLFLSFATDLFTLIIAVILIGIGIGSYKPLISATVAKCTPQKDRNIGYSIYYLIVNLAAATFPIVYVLLEFTNVLHPHGYYFWVFRAGAIFFIINLIVVIFYFQEVPRSGNVKTVGDVVNNIKIAFKDKKFVVMVILIGGFWALYSSFLNVLPFVLIGFKLVPFWFSAMVLAIFNPLTIILAGPFLAKFGEKIESIILLLGGVLVYCIGLSLIGLTLQWEFVIVGIIIASIGEFMVAPGYLAFVSKLAPKEKVSSYIGCNFLATMLGITLGTLVFGTAAKFIAFDMRMPNFMYGILVSFGLFLLVAFIIYYRSWGQDIIDRTRKIREEEEGIDEEEVVYREPFLFKIFDYRLSTIIPLILIPIILFATFSLGTKTFYGIDEDEEVIIVDWSEFQASSVGLEQEGTLTENGEEQISILIPEKNIISVAFKLSWSDEPDSSPLHENEPDQFTLSVEPANGTEDSKGPIANTVGSAGTINLEFDFFEEQKQEYLNGTGIFEVTVQLGTCGDHQFWRTSAADRNEPDTFNDWKLEISYTYYEKPEEIVG